VVARALLVVHLVSGLDQVVHRVAARRVEVHAHVAVCERCWRQRTWVRRIR
jgi:hypothetical protein